MNRKSWIICSIGFILVAGFIIFEIKTPNSALKKVAGSSSTLPEFSDKALIKPPVKSTTYSDPYINAKAVFLIDAASAYVLYEKNFELKVPIASTTKIMTATVVLDNYADRLDDVVTITPPMVNVEGSDIQLSVGEKIKVRDLLKGLLIMSGNDTAYALALHFGGKEAFVKEMNDKAVFLGLSSTYYQCPAGLDDEGYSNARDLAMLTSYALKNPMFNQIVKTSETTITSVDGKFTHELKNSNRLVRIDEASYLPFAIGVKTGFTNAAGHCLVSSAVENNHQIIGIVLNTNENTITASAKESKKLLEWGYANWNWN